MFASRSPSRVSTILLRLIGPATPITVRLGGWPDRPPVGPFPKRKALAVIAAIGVWQLAGQGTTSPAQRVVSLPPAASVSAPEQGLTYYIVSSDGNANRVKNMIAAQEVADALSKVRFVVANDDETVARTVQLVALENDNRYTAGQPASKVVDLRGQ